MMMRVKSYSINTSEIKIEIPCTTITIRRKYTMDTGSTENMLPDKYDKIIKAVLDSYSNNKPFDFFCFGRVII